MSLLEKLFGKKQPAVVDTPMEDGKPPVPVVNWEGKEFHINLDASSNLAVKRHLTRCGNLLRAMKTATPAQKQELEREYRMRKQTLMALGYTIERDSSEAFDLLAKELG